MLEIAKIADPQEQVETARALGAGKNALRASSANAKRKQLKHRKRGNGGGGDQVTDLSNDDANETVNNSSTIPEDDIVTPDYLGREPPNEIDKAFDRLKKAWAASTAMRQAWDSAPIEARTRFIGVVLRGRVA